jgi:hypothetical protein
VIHSHSDFPAPLALKAWRVLEGCELPVMRRINLDSQQILPLAKVALEAHALGNLEATGSPPMRLLLLAGCPIVNVLRRA